MRCGARWPANSTQLEIFKNDNPEVAPLTEECPQISATGVGTAEGAAHSAVCCRIDQDRPAEQPAESGWRNGVCESSGLQRAVEQAV